VIVGLGIDVCDIARVRKSIERHGARFLDRVLTPEEREYCAKMRDPAVPFAARFAAKEAAIKAMGGAPSGMRWQDMEVLPAQNCPPQLVLRNAGAARLREMGGTHVHLSLTHDGGVAAAVVVLEGRAEA
jgi:holo-[acyl-carrier protein] synthase